MAWLALDGEDAAADGIAAAERSAGGSEAGAEGLPEGAERKGKKGGRGTGGSKVRERGSAEKACRVRGCVRVRGARDGGAWRCPCR